MRAPLKSRGAGLGPVTEGILALHTLWRRLRDAGQSQSLYVLAGAAVCPPAVFILIAWCCTGGEIFFGRPLERIRALVEGAKSLLLEPSGTEGTFRTLFLRPYTPVSFEICSRSCQLGARGQRTLCLKNDRCPPPLRGVRREWDATPRSLWQQTHPSLLRHSAGSAAREDAHP